MTHRVPISTRLFLNDCYQLKSELTGCKSPMEKISPARKHCWITPSAWRRCTKFALSRHLTKFSGLFHIWSWALVGGIRATLMITSDPPASFSATGAPTAFNAWNALSSCESCWAEFRTVKILSIFRAHLALALLPLANSVTRAASVWDSVLASCPLGTCDFDSGFASVRGFFFFFDGLGRMLQCLQEFGTVSRFGRLGGFYSCLGL